VKIDILVATYRTFNSNAYACINAMVAYTKHCGHDVAVPAIHGNAMVHRARNQALQPIREDADWVLMVDDDMAPERNALIRLLENDAEVVSALTTTRELPSKLTVTKYDPPADLFRPIIDYKPGSVLHGQFGVGTGFLAVRKGVIDQAAEWYLSGRDWLADNRLTFDRMHVRAEARETERQRIEEKRRKLFADKNYLRIFHYSVHDAQEEHGEDMTFSRNLIRMGVPITVDSRVQVGHIGDFPYGPWNLNDESSKTLEFGSALDVSELVAREVSVAAL
jgi:glycosyltransferase involved in cell wall biosynthesis